MAVIAAAALDLYTKVQGVSALNLSAGLTVGGQVPDPGMTKIPLPGAWILLENGETTLDPSSRVVSLNLTGRLTYVVLLAVPYTSQTDLLDVQFPLVEEVIDAVHGKAAPSGMRWLWNKLKLLVVNGDRLVYRIEFVLDAGSM